MSNGKQICKICTTNKVKVKIATRKTSTVFVDQVGKEWHGNICPTCNVDRSNFYMKKLRNKEI